MYDADSAIKKLGRERAQRGSYLFKSLLSGNAQLALGSDWPVRTWYLYWYLGYNIFCNQQWHSFVTIHLVYGWCIIWLQVVDINPLGSIRTAMKRVPPGWEKAWISSECISLNDALIAWALRFFLIIYLCWRFCLICSRILK